MRPILLLLALLSLLPSFAQTGMQSLPTPGARLVGLGYAYTGVRGDMWSIFSNPAGITGLEKPSAGIYLEQRFLLRELTYGSIGAVYPFADRQSVGVDIRTFGFDAFRQNQIGLAYGITLWERFSIGLKAKYASITLPDLGQAGVFLVDLGMHVQFSEQIGVGFLGQNLNRASFTTQLGTLERTPSVLQVGLTYHPAETVTILADVVKEEAFAPSFRGGVAYQMIPELEARVGMGTEPLMLTAGLGVNWHNLLIDVAYSYTALFSSPHLSLGYSF